MIAIHYSVRIECGTDAEYVAKVAEVQTLDAQSVVLDALAKTINFQLQQESS